MVGGVIDKIESALNYVGVLSDKDTAINKAQRKELVGVLRMNGPKGPSGKIEGASFVDKISEVFRSNKFEASAGLSKDIDSFSKMIAETFSKYQREEGEDPTKTFENNTRRVASGVDSFASIGAGGNVYLGLNTLDVQKRQLTVLQSIDQKLSGQQTPAAANVFINNGSPGISRAQTASPVTN